jgi:hypothetical protein
MSLHRKPREYHAAIDALVEVCRAGQGQIGAERVRKGVWNQNASPTFLAEEHLVNEILKNLAIEDRYALAAALAKEFEAGVFESLKVLEELRISPFEEGYEGSPFHDFVGRLGGWQWPEN